MRGGLPAVGEGGALSGARSQFGGYGGAANEGGSAFRAAVAVWFLAHAMREREVYEELTPSRLTVPTGLILLEGDQHVDDLQVEGMPRTLYVQAKRSLPFEAPPKPGAAASRKNKFNKTVEQLVAQALREDFAPDSMRLVIAVGRRSRSLAALQRVLARKRASATGRLTKIEEKALRGFDEHLTGLDEAERRRVYQATTILFLESIEQPGSPEHGRARTLLEDVVVPRTHVVGALDALKHLVREQAANRLGGDLQEWMQLLRERNIPVLLNPAGPKATRVAVAQCALSSYRDWLTESASSVQIAGISIEVSPDTSPLHVAAGPLKGAGPTSLISSPGPSCRCAWKRRPGSVSRRSSSGAARP